MKSTKDHLQGYEKLSALDIRDDTTQLWLSYLLCLVGVVIFFLLFVGFTSIIHPDLPFSLQTYLNIGIPNMSVWVSILLVILDVILVLSLHELVHASVFYLDQRIPPQIGWRGLSIFAAAPGYRSRCSIMIVNTLAPFTVISLLGLVLITAVPAAFLSWVFIPTVVNAAATGGDFMTVA